MFATDFPYLISKSQNVFKRKGIKRRYIFGNSINWTKLKKSEIYFALKRPSVEDTFFEVLNILSEELYWGSN